MELLKAQFHILLIKKRIEIRVIRASYSDNTQIFGICAGGLIPSARTRGR